MHSYPVAAYANFGTGFHITRFCDCPGLAHDVILPCVMLDEPSSWQQISPHQEGAAAFTLPSEVSFHPLCLPPGSQVMLCS